MQCLKQRRQPNVHNQRKKNARCKRADKSEGMAQALRVLRETLMEVSLLVVWKRFELEWRT